MFRVTTINLTADLRSARPDLGPRDLGGLDARELTVVLDSFRSIDPVQIHDADPQVIVETPRQRFVVRTARGRLSLGGPVESGVAPAEFDVGEIVQEISRVPALTAHEVDAAYLLPRRRNFRPFVAVVLLLGSVALNGHTVYTLLSGETVRPPQPVDAVTEPRELTALTASAVGRYATGGEPGDRLIEITSDHRVRFLRVTPSGERLESEDTFRVGRIERRVCLATASSGVIEIGNIDTLTYYRDVYRRQ